MLPAKLDLYFDGSCGPKNPGGTAGYAWRLVDPVTGDVLASDHGEVCSGPEATNNVGEWGAVRNGLRHLSQQNWEGELNIRGDSQLVIYQLIGKYKCRKETLIPYHEECMILLKKWQWDAHWIPREENQECDLLSKRAYHVHGSDGQVPGSEDGTGDAGTQRGVRARASRRVRGGIRRIAEKAGRSVVNFGEETPEVSFD